MSAAGDAFALAVRDALRQHGPNMDAAEPITALLNLTLATLDSIVGPGQRIQFLEGATKVERELEAASKRRSS